MSSTAAAAASSILVFGATGDIGSRLVRLLAATASIAVTAAVRSLDKAKAKLPHNVKALHVDSADPLSIQQAVADSRADATFLYAQTASAAALDALKAGGIRRIVLLSSCHVGLPGLPQGALAQMHKKPEDAIRALGVTYTFLRADRFASNMLHFAKPIAAVGGKVTLAYPESALTPRSSARTTFTPRFLSHLLGYPVLVSHSLFPLLLCNVLLKQCSLLRGDRRRCRLSSGHCTHHSALPQQGSRRRGPCGPERPTAARCTRSLTGQTGRRAADQPSRARPAAQSDSACTGCE